MEKSFRKMLSVMMGMVVIVVMLGIGGITVSAEKQGDAISRIAISQVGITQASGADYARGAWCARFVAWCARQAGVSASVISDDAAVVNMRSAVLRGGGYEVSSPEAGDLIFYHDGTRYCHVAIMINSTESVHGNYATCYDASCTNLNHWAVVRVPYRSYTCSSYSIIRPNYSNTSITYSTIPTNEYYIRNHDSGQYLVVEGSNDTQTQNIGVWNYTGETGMQMEIVSEGTGHRIRPLCSSSRVVNVYADTVVSGKNVNLYDNTGDSSQRWGFEHIGDGYYYIRSMNNPSCVLAQSGNDAVVQSFTGANNQIWALESTDRTAPTISNVRITDIDATGYTVTCTVSDNVGISSVAFPTWTDANGQDDLLWMDGSVNGSTATFFVSVEDHNNETGSYTTHVYAYDPVGNYSMHAIVVTVDRIDTPRVTAAYNGHIYAFYDAHCSWVAAKRYSEAMGGHLVTINSAEEQAFVKSYMQGGWYWIGATDTGDEGNWCWITGEDWRFENWAGDQPDNYGSGEHYGHLYADGSWNDAENTLYQYTPGFIVEIEDLTPSQVYRGGDSEYLVFDQTLTWTEANVYCEMLGGHLATVTSAEESEILGAVAATQRYWLGATDTGDEGNWRWVTSEEWDYSNWGTGQPDNYGLGEHYLQLYEREMWNDSENFYPCGFICERALVTPFERGDITLDGEVNLNDATMLFYHVNGLGTLTDDALKAADYAADGGVDLNDATLLFYFINGLL